MRQIVGLLGTPVDILNTQEAMERLEQFLGEARFHQVATANTDFLINALDDRELRQILREADLVLPDGMPLVWAAKLMGTPLPERVTGADIVPALAQCAAEKGYRVFMLGGRPEVAQSAKERLEQDYPGIQIVGCLSPPARPLMEMDNAPILEAIQKANPQILFVAFGNPKQEKWIHLHREALQEVPVCIGVGGTFDFLAGKTVRAPLWMQKSGMEWLFRLLQEPKRLWKRYYRDITQFARYLYVQWRDVGRGKHRQGDLHSAPTGDCVVISIRGGFTQELIPQFQDVAEQAIDAGKHLLLDMQGVTSLDGGALGTLLNLPKRAAFRNCEVRLVNPPISVTRALTSSQMQDGLFIVTETIAQAFYPRRNKGLSWETQCGSETAVLRVQGASERHTTSALERHCMGLLQARKRVALDLRGVEYIDSGLVSLLLRLNEASEGALQVVPNSLLRERLVADKLEAHVHLAMRAEAPPNLLPQAIWMAEVEAASAKHTLPSEEQPA
jgi:N-acetylglucosaminyldiphosphoundecaprenol N-acetyl-beta-D-mannosaminyltransferase